MARKTPTPISHPSDDDSVSQWDSHDWDPAHDEMVSRRARRLLSRSDSRFHRFGDRFGRFKAWLAGWAIFLAVAPLVIVPPKQLSQVYRWWWELLRDDHAASVGLSVQGWLQTWFGWTPSKTGVTLAGLAVFILGVLAAVYRAPSTGHRQPSAVYRTLAC